MKAKRDEKLKLCLISSSGGHYEQLKMLAPLAALHDVFWVTEKTDYASEADYFLLQTGLKDRLFPVKMVVNIVRTLILWFKEKPDCVITTGTMVALPMAFLAKIMRRKLIYIETFARVYDGTKTGKLIYKYADLFIIQWKSLQQIYPEAVYGGSIY